VAAVDEGSPRRAGYRRSAGTPRGEARRTDLFAARFHEAGFSVLAFDYRHLGESGGQPRQVVRIREQLADWSAAVGFAATLRPAAGSSAGAGLGSRCSPFTMTLAT
jgi:predicted alpha/beta hydrolase